MVAGADAGFLAVAAPALTVATLVLRSRGRTGVMRTPQREFLDRSGPWATPALGAWMATATGLTVVAPLVLTRRRADEHAARSTVQPIASLLLLQVGLEGALGVLSDKSHPLTGTVFSTYRLGQLRRARASRTVRQMPRVRRLLTLQTWFWRANVAMLLVTAVARTAMRPDEDAGPPRRPAGRSRPRPAGHPSASTRSSNRAASPPASMPTSNAATVSRSSSR